MKTTKITILASCLAASFAFLVAGDFWEEKPWTEWDKDDALKLLQDSPWAETYQIRGAGSSIAIQGPSSATDITSAVPDQREEASRIYYLRFQSAKPVRMALAKLQVDGGNVDMEKAQEFVEKEPAPGHIVLVLRLQPGMDPSSLQAATTESLKKNVYLLLKESQKRVYLKQYYPPEDNQEAYLIFDRTENGEDLFTVEEDEVRVVIELDRQTQIKQKFELKDMVFEGKVEI